MKLFRLTTTLATAIGVALVGVYLAAAAGAHVEPDGGSGDSSQLITPPPATSTSGGTSVWWFVLVAVAAVAVAVTVMFAVRALRARRVALIAS